MGSCFGRCVSKETLHPPSTTATTTTASTSTSSTTSTTASCLWRRHHTDEQETELIPNASETCKRKNLIFRILKFKRKKPTQFIEKFWERQDLNYAKLTNKPGNESLTDIQLQNLDVNNLLSSNSLPKESALNYTTLGSHNAISSSRASSSLDLEWEHEYVQLRQYANQSHALLHTHHTHNTEPNVDPDADRDADADADAHTHNGVNNADSWQLLSSCNDNDDEHLNSLISLDRHSLPATTNSAAVAAAAAALTHERRALIRTRGNNATAAATTTRNSSITRTSSHNSWSHISTPESLEWDIDEEQQRQMRVEDDNLDHETLELLHQIEQLKNQVLHETGDGLYEPLPLPPPLPPATTTGGEFESAISLQNTEQTITATTRTHATRTLADYDIS